MLCPIAAEKPSSNWLDRLRSTKGFPISGDVGLDDFLLTNPTDDDDDEPADSPTPDTSASDSLVRSNSLDEPLRICQQSPEISGRNGEGDWLGVITNVFSDLFYMGGTTGIPRKKSARKQRNPKFCSPAPRDDGKAVVATTASLNSNHNSNTVRSHRRGDDVVEADEENDMDHFGRRGDSERCGGDRELKGYSRSEVTVIDTSYEVWKFDKLVFRKKNVWKVRDKKGKSWLSSAAAKKRKKGSDGLELGYDHGSVSKKKAKVFDSHSTVVVNGGNCVLPSDGCQKQPHDETMEEAFPVVAEELGEVPKINRFHGSRPPRMFKKGNSSVVLIKAMPNSKKSGENVPKNQLKERPRQQKA